MSEIKSKYESVYDDNGFYRVVNMDSGKTLVSTSDESSSDEDVAIFISDALNERDKLKEQNEKLKEQIRQTEAWLSFNTHPDADQIRVFRNSMIELLKSCE